MPSPKTKRRGSPFRAGAVVRVVRPLFVRRVGYPMDVAEEARKILADRRGAERIRYLLARFDLRATEVYPPWSGGRRDVKAVEKVAFAVAGELCRQRKWGGRERTVHTVEVPEFVGQPFRVAGVRFVKTGTYDPGGRQVSEDDFEPPGLLNGRTVRLLETPWLYPRDDGSVLLLTRCMEVEAGNCELVEEARDE